MRDGHEGQGVGGDEEQGEGQMNDEILGREHRAPSFGQETLDVR